MLTHGRVAFTAVPALWHVHLAARRSLPGVLLLALALVGGGCGSSSPLTTTVPTTTPAVAAEPLVPDSTLTGWPNAESRANSDPWLMRNHARLTLLQPKVLALNFVNARSMEDMATHFQALIAALRTGSSYHGYKDPTARPMLEYSIRKSIDLRDYPAPAGFPYRNSSRYPRESPVQGYFGLD
jgi:hypothetical protein